VSELFQRVRHQRTADEVVEQFETLVLEGVLRGGDRLPGERDMARQFDVSRPILRDALRVVEQRGLIVTTPSGSRVAEVTGQVFASTVADLIATNRKASVDYLEYRREVEAIAADYAARRATEADRRMLDAIMERMEAAHRNADERADAEVDVEFHSAIGECAHNLVLMHTLRSCYRLLADDVFRNRALVLTLPGARAALLDQHRAIHSAVVGGDADAARQAAVAHIAFIETASLEAERADGWERVARLRLGQRQAPAREAGRGDTTRAVMDPTRP
jgi:GntR family transcriptional repressor for pyruvate dehydrogenase complex